MLHWSDFISCDNENVEVENIVQQIFKSQYRYISDFSNFDTLNRHQSREMAEGGIEKR